MNKNKYKKLYNSYKYRLNKINKLCFKNEATPIDYFVTYLEMLRDFRLLELTESNTNVDNDLILASLVTALSEYEKSIYCIGNYYKVENNVAVRTTGEDEETTRKKYSAEKLFHWESFWNLVKLSVEDWVNEC